MKKITLVIIITSLLGCATLTRQSGNIARVEIDGDKWIPVKSFDNSTANDKHYVVRTDEDGSTIVMFGDGKNGARLPSGTNKIKLTYRSGGGRYTGVRQQQGRIQGDDCK